MTGLDQGTLGRKPKRPKKISPHAEKCLLAIGSHGYGRSVSLGGACALAYYHEYRETHDVDAWWEPAASLSDRKGVVECVAKALRDSGDVRTRSWGDVVSVELSVGGKKGFSFQIAERDARLEAAVDAPWPDGIRIDSFVDLVAAKVVALVERGAPRDFRDLHALCRAQMIDPRAAWELWRRRQDLAGRDSSPDRARLAVETHLARIETHRPLDAVANAEERERARDLRQWFRKEFLDAVVD